MTAILTRYEQTKQTFLHVRSYATAWNFMEAATAARRAESGEDGMDQFSAMLLAWVLERLEAENEQRAKVA